MSILKVALIPMQITQLALTPSTTGNNSNRNLQYLIRVEFSDCLGLSGDCRGVSPVSVLTLIVEAKSKIFEVLFEWTSYRRSGNRNGKETGTGTGTETETETGTGRTRTNMTAGNRFKAEKREQSHRRHRADHNEDFHGQ
jgi:hypothetical protein